MSIAGRSTCLGPYRLATYTLFVLLDQLSGPQIALKSFVEFLPFLFLSSLQDLFPAARSAHPSASRSRSLAIPPLVAKLDKLRHRYPQLL